MEHIKFKRLSDTAQLPTRVNPSDAGLDLYADSEIVLHELNHCAVKTGVAVEIPQGFYGRVAPRSGLSICYGYDVLAGVIDSGYTGEIIVIITKVHGPSLFIAPGDKIAQLIISPIVTPTAVWGEIGASDRGEKGFGSSGK